MAFFTKYIKQIVYGLGFVIAALLVFLITNESSYNDDYLSQGKIVFDNREFVVEIADTPKLQALGLSDRETLSRNTGMLFVFSEPDRHAFWMKDMNFSIDIVWFDDEFVVVDIEENLSPESYPEIFRSRVSARFALEVNAGQISLGGITIGEKATYIRF